MNHLFVVHRRNPHDIYIGRPGPWGNPFQIGVHGNRDEVIIKFISWYKLSGTEAAAWMRNNIHLLKGKTLGCWCSPANCHGNFLAREANK